MYKIELIIDKESQITEGQSLLSAVKKLKKPKEIKTLSNLVVKNGEKQILRVLNIPQVNKLLGGGINQEVMLNNLEIFLK